MILLGAMALGVVQIITGMAISFVEKCKAGDVFGAVFEEGTWWVIFGGGARGARHRQRGRSAGRARHRRRDVVYRLREGQEGASASSPALSAPYTTASLATSAISPATPDLMAPHARGQRHRPGVNTIGAIAGNLIVFLIISIAGNALNFALNLLGCFVHDLRLQCLEYFGKFYNGGKPFRPP